MGVPATMVAEIRRLLQIRQLLLVMVLLVLILMLVLMLIHLEATRRWQVRVCPPALLVATSGLLLSDDLVLVLPAVHFFVQMLAGKACIVKIILLVLLRVGGAAIAPALVHIDVEDGGLDVVQHGTLLSWPTDKLPLMRVQP